MSENDVVSGTFRALVENADRKFARVRDVPAYGRVHNQHYFHKVFKAYMRLWKYQQENRAKLVEAGLNRWEIGEIASRIGQLYFGQYMRTSEARFLVEAYVFYEAILSRRYFEGGSKSFGKKDLGVRFKELRFYARFLLVSLILNRTEMVQLLAERFRALVDDSRANYRVSFASTAFFLAALGFVWLMGTFGRMENFKVFKFIQTIVKYYFELLLGLFGCFLFSFSGFFLVTSILRETEQQVPDKSFPQIKRHF